MALTQLWNSGYVERVGPNHWNQRTLWVCPNAEAAIHEDDLYAATSTLRGAGAYVPKCYLVKVHHSWHGTLSLLEAYYRTPRAPGYAKVGISFSPQERIQRYDLNGKQLEGWNEDLGNTVYQVKPVSGSIKRVKYVPIITIETAYADSFIDVPAFVSYLDKVNANPLTGLFGNWSPGQCLMLGPDFSAIWREDELWYVTWRMMVELAGWNSLLKVQKFAPFAMRVPRFSLNGSPVDEDAASMVSIGAEKPGYLQASPNGDGTDTWSFSQTGPEDTVFYAAHAMPLLYNLVLSW